LRAVMGGLLRPVTGKIRSALNKVPLMCVM
jgi:hypothetical protein